MIANQFLIIDYFTMNLVIQNFYVYIVYNVFSKYSIVISKLTLFENQILNNCEEKRGQVFLVNHSASKSGDQLVKKLNLS